MFAWRKIINTTRHRYNITPHRRIVNIQMVVISHKSMAFFITNARVKFFFMDKIICAYHIMQKLCKEEITYIYFCTYATLVIQKKLVDIKKVLLHGFIKLQQEISLRTITDPSEN